MSKVTAGQKKSNIQETKKGKYAKAAAKPALTTDQRQKKYYGSLCDQIEGDHLENALRTTNKLLALDPSDSDAIQVQLFLLLKASKYEEALKRTEKDPEQFKFERAYALYRLQQEKEAEELLQQADQEDRAVALLQAQINYRLGRYAEALEIYNDLLASSSPSLEEYSDIQTNILATETNLNFLQSGFLTAIHQLPPLPRGQTLEDTPLPSLNPTHGHSVAEVAAATEVDAQPPKPKPPRKSRVPKGVIPGVTPPPDPERWIKKSERTQVQTGGHGKKKKAGGGATQGSTVAVEQGQKSGGGGKGKKKK
ncbi:hypothetical protein CPB86DRAFT_782756 [Serendipita vermifera]|nr:hypothetical protein CPB86DRAFT_782756 [Serendipita vermifera]